MGAVLIKMTTASSPATGACRRQRLRESPFADHLTEAQKKAYIIADNRMAMEPSGMKNSYR